MSYTPIFLNIDGTSLLAVPSLSALQSLNEEHIRALRSLGISTLAELIGWAPIQRARVLVAIGKGAAAHDIPLNEYLEKEFSSLTRSEYPKAPISAVLGIGMRFSEILTEVFGIKNVEQLAEFPPYIEAISLANNDPTFSEPPSAPRELMPRMYGGIASTAMYSSFVRETSIRSYDLNIRLGSDAEEWVDRSLGLLFSTNNRLELSLGYVCAYKQNWLNFGTALGEPIFSLPLAPGESRNVSIIDWKRTLVANRTESTSISEQLENTLVHKRALDEVVRATATEHLAGGTTTKGFTVGGSAGGTISEAAVMAAAGAATGNVMLVAGAAQAGGSGNESGGIGGVISGNYQYGKITTNSDGERTITSDTAQTINDVATQKASALRSLWSSVIITDTQSETSTASTYNITNYNHSHALTVQYYELLQRYRVEIGLDRCEPVLFVPFRPLNFDEPTVLRWWSVLRRGIADKRLVAQFDAILRSADIATMPPAETRAAATVKRIDFELDDDPRNEIRIGMMQGVRWDRTTTNDRNDIEFSGSGLHWALGDLGVASPKVSEPMTIEFEVRHNYAKTRTLIGSLIAEVVIDQKSWQVPFDVDIEFPAATGHVHSAKKAIIVDWLAAMSGYAAAPSETVLARVLDYIAARRYAFTKLVLQSAEPEQFVDMVEALWITKDPSASSGSDTRGRSPAIQPLADNPSNERSARQPVPVSHQTISEHLPLTALIDPQPLGTVDNHFIFPLKRRINIPASFEPRPLMPPLLEPWTILKQVVEYPAGLAEWATATRRKGPISVSSIDLPTSGTFAEAILGRSNASEKIDLTRFWNWQDSPIPNSAPSIAEANTESRAQPTTGLGPTQPNTVLNLMTPTALPDPAGMAAALSALQNGGMFRDSSGQAALTQTLANLASLAEKSAGIAGQLSGDAAAKALDRAQTLGEKVLDATKSAPSNMNIADLFQKSISDFGGILNLPQAVDGAKAKASEEAKKLWEEAKKLTDDIVGKAGDTLDWLTPENSPPDSSTSESNSSDTTTPPQTTTAQPALESIREKIIEAAREEDARKDPEVKDGKFDGNFNSTDYTHRIEEYFTLFTPEGDEYRKYFLPNIATHQSKWCNGFAVFCWKQAGASIAPIAVDKKAAGGGCKNLVKWFKDEGRWLSEDAIPQKGDMAFFGEKEEGKKEEDIATHVALVVDFVKDGPLTTIEGNYYGGIGNNVPRDYPDYSGYGCGPLIGYGSVDTVRQG